MTAPHYGWNQLEQDRKDRITYGQLVKETWMWLGVLALCLIWALISLCLIFS